MNLAVYFAAAEGAGILGTADAAGNVDLAVYEPPEVVDVDTIALNMLNRRSYRNLQQNPRAAYMFIERSQKWSGWRLYLEKIGEIPGRERVAQLRAAGKPITDPAQSSKFYVTFKVTGVRPLVGDSQ